MVHVYPSASCNCLQAVLKECMVSGLVVSCMEAIQEHGNFYVVAFLPFFKWNGLNFASDNIDFVLGKFSILLALVSTIDIGVFHIVACYFPVCFMASSKKSLSVAVAPFTFTSVIRLGLLFSGIVSLMLVTNPFTLCLFFPRYSASGSLRFCTLLAKIFLLSRTTVLMEKHIE